MESRRRVTVVVRPSPLQLTGIAWFSNPTAGTRRLFRTADFQVCRIAGFPTRRPFASLARPTHGPARRLGNRRYSRTRCRQGGEVFRRFCMPPFVHPGHPGTPPTGRTILPLPGERAGVRADACTDYANEDGRAIKRIFAHGAPKPGWLRKVGQASSLSPGTDRLEACPTLANPVCGGRVSCDSRAAVAFSRPAISALRLSIPVLPALAAAGP